MGPVIGSLIRAGLGYVAKKGAKKAAKKKIDDLAKGAQRAGGKSKAEKSSAGTSDIRKAKEAYNKSRNEMKSQDTRQGSATAKKMMEAGTKKAKKKVDTVVKSKKPGMSSGYKTRAKLREQLSNTKRQMIKQGHSKELAKKIGDLQNKIDKSYGK
jgi:hypothetical protein